jgi:hypothetical protein
VILSPPPTLHVVANHWLHHLLPTSHHHLPSQRPSTTTGRMRSRSTSHDRRGADSAERADIQVRPSPPIFILDTDYTEHTKPTEPRENARRFVPPRVLRICDTARRWIPPRCTICFSFDATRRVRTSSLCCLFVFRCNEQGSPPRCAVCSFFDAMSRAHPLVAPFISFSTQQGGTHLLIMSFV